MKDRAHDEVMSELFRSDPAYASLLKDEVVLEGSHYELAILSRQLDKAFDVSNCSPAVKTDPL